ncbi:Probable phthiotriol/phenolphthiotriol dimycocerosates methyltransferase 2 [Durusdinium trenchii]|uniref:Probable phthiotriol/phenolphthiotriol dimycocerosates methyltransferase 2 n=1 Tax=Durusdinium trenchii TaxID=1381693 RepID=A0ABP0L8N3_9DINO
MLLRATQQPYVDRLYTEEEWKVMKSQMPEGKGVPGVATRPVGNRGLPVLQLPDGTMIPETADIARFICEKRPDLFPAEQAAEAYEMTLAVNTYPLLFPQCMLASYPAEVTEAILRGELPETYHGNLKDLPPYGEVLQVFLHWEQRLGDQAFFGGAAPHFGEFFLFAALDALRQTDPSTAAKVGRLQAWYDRMGRLPAVEGYLQARPPMGPEAHGKPGSLIRKYQQKLVLNWEDVMTVMGIAKPHLEKKTSGHSAAANVALALILQKAEKLGDLSRIAGVVHLVVTQTPCVSCLGAMAQFRALMPEVHLHCHFHRLRQEREARAADPRERRRSICSIYETTSGSSEGQPSFSDALEVFRRMLRVVSMEKDRFFSAALTSSFVPRHGPLPHIRGHRTKGTVGGKDPEGPTTRSSVGLPDLRESLPESILGRLAFLMQRWWTDKRTDLYPPHLDICNSGGKFGVAIPKPELVLRKGFPKGSWEWNMHMYGAALYWQLATATGDSMSDTDSELLRGKRILEVSCMRGGGARYLAEVTGAGKYVAVDEREENIETCKSHDPWPSLSYERLSVRDFSTRFAAGDFDVLLCVEAGADFEKVEFAEQAEHVLSSGGLLLMCDVFMKDQVRELLSNLEHHFEVLEAELLNVLGAAGTAEEDHGLPLPESVMLPSPGTFHSLIGMAMAEGRVKEAIGLVKYQRLKELPVFARSLAMLAEDLRVPPRLAMRFLHESQVAGHLASRRLLSFLLRRLAKLDRPDASRLAVTFLRRCCRKEDSMGVYYRPDYPIPTIKRYPGSGTVAACLALAPSELLPRWARALGIWARCSQPDHEEDAAVPFRALMKRLTSHGGSVEETCRGEVLRALQATGLLERMVAQKVMDEDQVARVF